MDMPLLEPLEKNGEIYSTEEEKPIKRIIEHEWEFLDGCVDTIKSIFSKG